MSQLAFYCGNTYGFPYGPRNIEFMAERLGHFGMWGEDFLPFDYWENIKGPPWMLSPWGWWRKFYPGRRLIIGVPMLGPTGTLEEVVNGAYDSIWRTLSERLVAAVLHDSILRIGWEFNGGWYRWGVNNDIKAAQYAAAFRRIVDVMRSVSGQQFEFCWNAANNWCSFSPNNAWPGDDYVDYVGVDIYDTSWNSAKGYPLTSSMSPEEIETRRTWVWNNEINIKSGFHALYWKDFAATKGKRFCVPEWGVQNIEAHGGGDDVRFIERMVEFVERWCDWHCYFEVNASDGNHLLFPPFGGEQKFPNAAQRFLDLFRA